MIQIDNIEPGLIYSDIAGYNQLAARFVDEQHVEESSRKTYRWAINKFFRWINENGYSLSAMQRPDVINYEKSLAEKHYSGRTIASYLNVVKLFYQWTETNGLYKDITRNLRIKNGHKKHSRMYLTTQQARELLSVTKENHLSARNFAIINLILYTGLRTIEISRAKISDIQYLEGTRILRVRGKGKGEDNNEDFVVLIDQAWQPIKEYLDKERKGALRDEPLFVTNGDGHKDKPMSTRTIQFICKQNLRAIALDSHAYSAHSLRHTTAMQILDNGGNLYDVQRVLRHSSIDTTNIYAESFKDKKHIKDSPERMIAGIYDIEYIDQSDGGHENA